MRRPRGLAGLDVGTGTTTAVIVADDAAWSGGEEQPRVLGIGQAPSGGVRNRAVTSIEEAVESIRTALQGAEEMAGLEAATVFAGVAGDHVRVERSSGVVAVSDREVMERDIDRVHEVARAVPLPDGRELIHAIPQDYAVDGTTGVRDPAGMEATRLESEVCLVTADVAATQNLRRAIDRAGWRLDELVLAPLATNLAVLDPERRRAGVVLVEIGAAATEILAFRDERLCLVATLPWGGGTVTNDIVKGLGVPAAEAERLKVRHGIAQARRADATEKLEIPGPVPGRRREVGRDLLAHIIEQRLDEMFGLIYEELEARDLLGTLAAGVVLTGGAARLDGLAELAQEVFDMPVSIGLPGPGLGGLVDSVRRPECATSVGLAMYGHHRRRERPVGSAVRALGRVGEWLKEFF
ncbi:MAG: cell division protein FtsA [Gemmatimonadota bacterium]|nr:cell division protein FtsA [Gemmatimonadota bacterium]